ncbi:MAG: histidine triad nucleotide-binding protein [Gemmatimonadota bacterium]|nr:histidine triad nucleotide-binding protein [Gemmatimonadota bacterium]
MPEQSTNCIFCRIASREIAATVVAETGGALAFRDLDAKAPTHVLVIPKSHVASLVEAAEAGDGAMLGEFMLLAAQVARDAGLDRGYRVVVNTGPDGGQTVGHLHAHVLGGRRMAWPPG